MARFTLTPADTAATITASAPPNADNTNVALGSFTAIARRDVILSIQADYDCTNVGGNSTSLTEYSLDGAAWVTIRLVSQVGAGSTSLSNQVDAVNLGNLTATQVGNLRVRSHATATSAVSDADSLNTIDTWSVTYATGSPAIIFA
jgi:hypothetical protein